MFQVENAYRLNVIAPTTHNYSYTDAETVVQHDTVSPVSRTNPLRTQLSTGYAACLSNEWADSATVHQYVEWEDSNGNTNTLGSVPVPGRPGYYYMIWNGVVRTSSQSSQPYDFCIRTDYAVLSGSEYVSGGRVFYRGYYSPTRTFTDSWTLNSAKLAPLAWSQDEKMHNITMSG